MAVAQGDSLGVATLTLAADPVPLDAMLASAQKRTEASLNSMEAMSGKRLATVGQNMSRLGSQWTRTVSLPIIGGGAAMVKVASDFESALTQVQTQAGASASEIKNMREEILKLAPVVGQTPVALANALYHVESAGIRSSQALDVLTQSAKLAQIGHSDLEQTTNALVAVMKSAPKDVKNATDAIGIMNAVVGQGNMRMGDLVGALSTGIIPAAKSAGLGLRDVGAALDVMTSRGVPAQDAATRLRMTISLLSAPTSKAAKELKGIGLSSSQLALDMRKPDGLVIAVEDLKKHLESAGLSATQQNQVIAHAFGGGRSSAGILTLLQNTKDLQGAFDGIGKHSGADQVREEWKKTQEDMSVRFAKLKAKAEVEFVDIGTKIAPEFLKVAGQVADDAKNIADAFTSLPKGAQDAIITGALTAAALGPALKLAGVLTTFVGRTWDALKVAEGLVMGKGFRSAAGRIAGSSVANMEVAEMIVKNMVGGPGGGGGAAGKGAIGAGAVTAAETTGLTALGAAGAVAAGIASVAAGPIAVGLLMKPKQDPLARAVATTKPLSSFLPPELAKALARNLQLQNATTGVLGTPVWSKAQTRLLQEANVAFKDYTSTHNVAALENLRKKAAAVAKEWPQNASAMNVLVRAIDNATHNKFPGLADAAKGTGDAILGNFGGKIARAKQVVENSTGDAKKIALQHFAELQRGATAQFATLEQNVAKKQARMAASIQSGSANLVPVVKKNFDTLAGSIQQAMQAGLVSTESGLELISKALSSELKALGVNFPHASLKHETVAGLIGAAAYATSANPGGGTRGRQATGGLVQFGRGGEAGTDQIPVNMGGRNILVGSGEVGAVFTRHQFSAANQMLAGIGGLPGLFKGVNRPHYMAQGGMWRNVVASAESLGGDGYQGNPISPYGYSELGVPPNAANVGTALGRLPYQTHMRIRAGGRQVVAAKQDIGTGSSFNPVMGLYPGTVAQLGLSGGEFHVSIERADGVPLTVGSGSSPAAAAAAAFKNLNAPGVKGGGAVASIVRAGLQKVTSAANRYGRAHQPTAAPAGGGGVGGAITGAAGPPGLATFEGVTMSRWIANELEWATKHGWHGQPTSGYRPGFDPHTSSGRSEHALINYPGGAVDFGGPVDPAAYATKLALVRLAQRLNYPGPRLQMPVFQYNPGAIGGGDDGHLSGDGHSRGGFVNAATGYLGPVPTSTGRERPSVGMPSLLGMTPQPPSTVDNKGRHHLGHLPAYTVPSLAAGSPVIAKMLGSLNKLLDPNTGGVAVAQDEDQSLQNIFGTTPFANISTAADAIVTPADGSAPYVDQSLVSGRVGQLMQLFHWELIARNDLQQAMKLIGPLLIRIRNAIAARRKQIERIKAKIRANLAKIRALLANIKTERGRKLPKGKAGAAARKARDAKIGGFNRQIVGLKNENATLGGDRDKIGSGGQIGALAGQISTLQTDFGNVTGDQQSIVGPSGIGGTLGAAKVTLTGTQQAIGALSPQALGLALAAASSSASGAGAGTSPATDGTLAGLDQQKIDLLNQRLAVSQDQYGVLANLPPFGGSFRDGGIVPGAWGEPRTIIAHAGEEYLGLGQSRGEVHEHNIIFGPKTRWLEDFVDVRVDHKTRSMSRNAKPLPGARAGQLGGR